MIQPGHARFRLPLVALALSGCLPQLGTYERPDGGLTNPTDAEALSCVASADLPTAESIAAAAEALADFRDGTVEVALSPLGCHRFQREIRDGALVRSAFVQQIQVGVSTDFTRLVPVIAVVAEWRRGTDGVLRGGIDMDTMADDAADTYFEYREVEDPSARRFERTWWNEASDEMTQRLTLSVEADDRVRQVRERLVEGVLTTVEDFYAVPGSSDEPLPGPVLPIGGPCAHVACDTATSARLDRLARAQQSRAFDCYSADGMQPGSQRARTYVELALRWNHAHEWMCIPEGCGLDGQWCSECQAEGGPLRISVRIGDRTDEDITSTLIHELAHGIVGLHSVESLPLIDNYAGVTPTYIDNYRDDDTDERVEYMLHYTDPTYACQSYCAAAGDRRLVYRNACTCAACLGVRPCDEPCSALPSCTVRSILNPSVAIASQAIGTVCVESHLLGADTYSWFSELATCMTPGACSGECRSLAPPDPCTPGCH